VAISRRSIGDNHLMLSPGGSRATPVRHVASLREQDGMIPLGCRLRARTIAAKARGPWGTEVGFDRIKASGEILARRVGQ
jgi:hypothetical protein